LNKKGNRQLLAGKSEQSESGVYARDGGFCLGVTEPGGSGREVAIEKVWL
jgi:hypothetical protein